ncbi:Ubiquitin carboxyl-terminal hydrolase 1 [Bienertia sinuspersici]
MFMHKMQIQIHIQNQNAEMTTGIILENNSLQMEMLRTPDISLSSCIAISCAYTLAFCLKNEGVCAQEPLSNFTVIFGIRVCNLWALISAVRQQQTSVNGIHCNMYDV